MAGKGKTEAATPTVTDNSDAKVEGPVATAIHKRLRAAKKKITRIAELEAKQAAGGVLTEEQVPVINSKACVLAVIEELEKLGSILADAVKEEQDLVASKAEEAALAKAAHREELLKRQAAEEVARAKAEGEAAAQGAGEAAAAAGEANLREAISKLVHLCYFSTLFDPEGAWSCQLERQAFLTYGTPLSEADLLGLAAFGRLMRARPQGKLISHQDALVGCLALATAYATGHAAEAPELPGIQGDAVSTHVATILASSFCSIQPEQQVQPSLPAAPGPAVALPPPVAQPASSQPPSTMTAMTVSALEQSLFTRTAPPAAPAAAVPLQPLVPPVVAAEPPVPPAAAPLGFFQQQGGFMPGVGVGTEENPSEPPGRHAPAPHAPRDGAAPAAVHSSAPARATNGGGPPISGADQRAGNGVVGEAPRADGAPAGRGYDGGRGGYEGGRGRSGYEGRGSAPGGRGRGGPGGKGCFTCGEVGHLARDCPQKRTAPGGGGRGRP